MNHPELTTKLAIPSERRPEWAGAWPGCPQPSKWEMLTASTESPEVEVLEFIYSLTRALKPRIVVETGTGGGFAALVMAQAMSDDPDARLLLTCEVDSTKAGQARDVLADYEFVEVIAGHSLAITPPDNIDLLFCDSGIPDRVPEIRRFRPAMSEHGVILVHDTSPVDRGTWGDGAVLRSDLGYLVEDGILSGLVHLPTPRGLSLATV